MTTLAVSFVKNLMFLLLFLPLLSNAQIQAKLEDKNIITSTVLQESTEVLMGEIKMSLGGQLITSGLGPCSALAVVYDGRILLGHVGPIDTNEKIVSALNNFTKDVQDLSLVKVYVLPGWTMSTLTTNIIFGALMDANLIKRAVFFNSMPNPFDTFGINENGPIYIKSDRQPR
ncbi:MAG: hypothetical protein ACK5Y2_12250 [Bdellovibrionales bacterium]